MCSLALRISLAPLYRSVIYWSNICLESRELTLSMHEEEGGGGGEGGGLEVFTILSNKIL